MNEIYVKLSEVFGDVFDEDVSLTSSTTAADIEGWDSLHHIQLIMSVERAFKIRFSASETSGMKNVGQFVELIEKKTAAKA